MKAKKLLTAVLAALTAVSLAACGGVIQSDAEFQRALHQSETTEMDNVCETPEGFYFALDTLKGPYIYFMDRETKSVTILCGKPECAHSDSSCDAYIRVNELWADGGRLYYTHHDYEEGRDGVADLGLRLHSVGTDGKKRRVVQNLELVPGGDTSQRTPKPILHRGVVYFPYSGVLYSVPLGGDVTKDAKAIWGEEIEDASFEVGGMTMMAGDLNALGFDLWAEGDTVYFMVNLPQTDGTYRDTLYAYDTVSEEVQKVWEVPGADLVGHWDEEGVSVSKWYILDGTVYFFLSQNGLWRQDLSSGEPERLADTTREAPYGSGIFSDDYFCLMNDVPEQAFAGAVAVFGFGHSYVGGDTVFVYGLDGELKAEISLASLYDEIEGLSHCMLAFCDGEDVYFVAESYTVTGGPVTDGAWTSMGQKVYTHTLYCANIVTGELTRVCSWN